MKTLVKILFVALISSLPMASFAQLTTNDGYIHVRSQTLYGDDNSALFWLSNNSNTTQLVIKDKENTLYGKVFGSGNGQYFGLTDGDGNWSYLTKKDQFTAFRINNSEKMRILANGLVGIGTNTPEAKLQVKGAIRATNNVNVDDYLEFTHGGAGSFIRHEGIGFMHFRFEDGNGMVLAPGNKLGIGRDVPQANLDVRGRVRIGETTMPGDYKLYVENGILTERIRVASKDGIEWADYVFEADYDLNSTEEVKTFIQENKHLPNVPSAKEVAEKGVDIVEMDATLLRQIEELWLHTIQLNERIQELEKQLEDKSDK